MLPIRVRQFPRFVWQAALRAHVLGRPPAQPSTFHLCYFSCRSYFSYLYCSLHSLVRHAGDQRTQVLVFSDNEQPLSLAQIDAIVELIPSARVIPWPKSMGWGAAQIESIWRAYRFAAEAAADGDFIGRVDSDVFFFNDTVFRVAARSGADLVGDGHYVDFEYCQGGCYFFRVSAVRRIVGMLNEAPVAGILKHANINVEDQAAHYFATRLGLKVWLTWFMMFPDELRNAGGLTQFQRWKFSCAHFVMKNKSAMLEAYEREVLGGVAPPDYTRALRIP